MALNIDINLDFLDNEFTKTTLSPNSLSPSDSSSASSGISSLDSDELKKRSTPLISQDESDANSTSFELKDESDGTSSSFEIKEEDVAFAEQVAIAEDVVVVVEKTTMEIQAEQKSVIMYEKPVQIIYNNRDCLDLCSTVSDTRFKLQYAHLPENNVQMFFANRSQYYRLGAGGEKQEYLIEKCPCCDFSYPLINNPNASPTQSANPMTESILKFLNSPEIMMNLPSAVPITKRNINMNGGQQHGGNSSINNPLQYNAKATLNNINYMDSYKSTKVSNYNNFAGNYNNVPNSIAGLPNAAIALFNMMTRGNSSFPSNPNNTLANNARFSNGTNNSCDSFNNNNFNNMNGNSSQAAPFRPY